MTSRSPVLLMCLISLLGLFSSTGSIAVEQICSSCKPNNMGDLVHRASSWDAAFVGHAGFKTTSIFDVVPNRPAGKAMSSVTVEQFINGQEYWGGKMLLQAPRRTSMDAQSWRTWTSRIVDKLEFLQRSGVNYDMLHTNQKGGQRSNGYFVFDCVGFTEHMWEYFGYNPTADELETGAGWPLTPREQRDSPFVTNSLPLDM